jgi:hypothetical protein
LFHEIRKANSIKQHPTNFTSHLETPWWKPGSSANSQTFSESVERETFINYTEKALDVARAAEYSLKTAELHLEGLVVEGELNVQVLKDEVEEVRAKGQAARHQIAALRATLQSEGVTPKPPQPYPFLEEDGVVFSTSDSRLSPLSTSDHIDLESEAEEDI